MKAPFTKLADAVTANVAGQADFERFRQRAKTEFLDPDDLMRAILLAQAAGPDRLRGFARGLQKLVEREASNAHR